MSHVSLMPVTAEACASSSLLASQSLLTSSVVGSFSTVVTGVGAGVGSGVGSGDKGLDMGAGDACALATVPGPLLRLPYTTFLAVGGPLPEACRPSI